jgi:hypothetical protein
MAVRIEDAGFEIRDMIAWVYSSGFPKSLDVSKAIDKAAGAEREVVGVREDFAARAPKNNFDQFSAINPSERGINSQAFAAKMGQITAPATKAAHQWQGWGTALKPALESLTYATKPLDCLGYCSKMIANLNEKIELCRQIANNAEKSLRHFQAASQEEKTNTVPESVAIPTEEVQKSPTGIGKADATSSRADTSESTPEMEPTALNTLLSWRNTLGGVFDVMKTSTTITVFETITDWKILSYCLSQITPDTITKARSNLSGLSADALRAVEYLNVSLACCANTLALSALAPAMSQEAERCRDAGVSPNLDLITVARKPLGEKTVAANVLEHGTGAINVDGCRVSVSEQLVRPSIRRSGNAVLGKGLGAGVQAEPPGRWPANLIHDGSDEVVGLFPVTTSGKPCGNKNVISSFCSKQDGRPLTGFGDTGSASRFFYCSKASKKDRDEGCEMLDAKLTTFAGGTELCNNGDGTPRNQEPSNRNHHPTVKPTDLMRYLCRLVTQPGGVVLDPFMGSGSTGKAAVLEGFQFIGIEREGEYLDIATRRIAAASHLLCL